jgi:glycine/D-amino acid oxidase-like deaminating enzyme
MTKSHDLIVIGAGMAGVTAANKASAQGWDVAIVDALPYGGTCALRGCDPTKGVGAVRRFESVTASDEAFELRLEFGELALSRPDVIQLGQEQGVHVDARDGAFAAQIEDAGHLDQAESGRPSAADEREPGEDRGVVLAVPVGAPTWLRKQTSALVKANGLRRHARGLAGFSDAHGLTLRLYLASPIKV